MFDFQIYLKAFHRVMIIIIGVILLSACYVHDHRFEHGEADGGRDNAGQRYDNSANERTKAIRYQTRKEKIEHRNADRTYKNNARHAENNPEQYLPAFFHYLSEGYADFAQQEDYEHHFKEQAVFKDKSAKAKQGIRVHPHQVTQRIVPNWSMKELKSAREQLMEILSGRAFRQHPYLLAQAQVMYDCWLEEQEENINQHDVEICRDAFYDAYNQIQLKLGLYANENNQINRSTTYPAKVFQDYPAKVRQEECACDVNYPEVTARSFILYFELDSAELTEASIRMIKTISSAANQLRPEKIIVQGHTDRAGKQKYNTQLSRKRVNTVISGLIIAGIDKTQVQSGFFGEDRPRVMTIDGKVRAENRRVEIRFE